MKRPSNSASAARNRQRGSLMIEMTVALGLMAFTLMPLSVSFFREQASLRALYQRAIAIEIVDGEWETLVAGEWKSFPAGTHDYPVTAGSARNLPPGKFTLVVGEDRLRLEWRPAHRGGGGPVIREASL